LGVLGHNGAGKTTLLKLLNGLITPDKGSISMRGKIGALIALGAGFNPALTGRENILINSAILGKSRKETEEKIAQVIDFSGLQDFIDAPVQSYSSGMQVRLGFATAVLMIEPDVLILDEVLAVGDAAFRAKCYNEINKLSKKTAIILISHSMTHISRLATQVMVLKRGEKVFHGSPDKGINEYYRSIEEKEQQSMSVLNGPVRVQSITLRNRNTNDKAEIIANTAEELELLISISSNIAIDEIVIDLCFISQSGDFVAESNNYLSGQRLPLAIGQNKCQVSIKSLDLNPGVYSIDCLVMCKNMSEHYDWQKNILKIEVRNNRFASANYQMASIFNMELPSSK
jgi:lipopolysaccharide transport system ATP-binding protein